MQSFYFSIHYFSLYMYKHHCTLIWVCEWTSTNFLDMCFSFSLSLLENWNGISIFFVTLCLSMSIWQYFSNQLHIHIDFLFLQNHWQFPPIFFHFSSLLLTIQLHSIYSNILSNSFFFFQSHNIFIFSKFKQKYNFRHKQKGLHMKLFIASSSSPICTSQIHGYRNLISFHTSPNIISFLQVLILVSIAQGDFPLT